MGAITPSLTLLLPPAPFNSSKSNAVSGQKDTRIALGDIHSKLTGAKRPKRSMPKEQKKEQKQNHTPRAHTCTNTA